MVVSGVLCPLITSFMSLEYLLDCACGYLQHVCQIPCLLYCTPLPTLLQDGPVSGPTWGPAPVSDNRAVVDQCLHWGRRVEHLTPTSKSELPAYSGLLLRGLVPICLSSYAALAGLELEMILCLPPKNWDYRHTPLYSLYRVLEIYPKAPSLLTRPALYQLS